MVAEQSRERVESFTQLMAYSCDSSLLERHYDVLGLMDKGQYEEALKTAQQLIRRINQFSWPDESKLDLRRKVADFVRMSVYSIRGHYLPIDQMQLGWFVDAKVQFVEGRGHNIPGFWVDNGGGGRRKCIVRWSDAEEGDFEKLLITGWDNDEVVLDPRPENGDLIRVRLRDGRKPNFRFMMYDGILEGEGELGYLYEAKIRRYHRYIKRERRLHRVVNFGVIYAEPLSRLERCSSRKEELKNYRIQRGQ